MNKLSKKLSISILVSAIIFISSFTQAFAEDIEIYNRTQTIPNVLFVVDFSRSMTQELSPGGPTRLENVKDALDLVLNGTYTSLNVGFMDFGGDSGSGVDWPVSDINAFAQSIEPGITDPAKTVGAIIGETISRMPTPNSSSKTPLIDAYYEAARYFKGDTPDHGWRDWWRPSSWNDTNVRYQGGGNGDIAAPTTWASGWVWDPAATTTYSGYCNNTSPKPPGTPYTPCSSVPNEDPSTCVTITTPPSDPPPYVSGCNVPKQCPPGQLDPTGNECLVNKVCPSGQEIYTDPPPNAGLPDYERCRLEVDSGRYNPDPVYQSPINTQCTANHIVLLTDGAPSVNLSKSKVQSMIGSSCADISGTYGSALADKGQCGPDLASYLSDTSNPLSNPAGYNFNVNTYAIGFQLAAYPEVEAYLRDISETNGGGSFIPANGGDPNTLVTALQSLVSGITNKSRTIARVGNTLDLSTLGSSRDEVYVPMFTAEPNQPRWSGNLKGYMFDPGGVLVGLGGNPVFNASGDFSSSSRSFWTSSADGGDVTLGGVAGLLNPATRNVKTDDGPGTSRIFQSLDTANTALTGNPALFGLPGATTTAEMQELISWARGEDVDDEDIDGSTADARNFVGDALHTDPVVANYTGSIERVAYFMTNEGYLHAIDVTGNTSATGGNELFSYMPSELLDNLSTLRQNAAGPKVYGLDGPLSLFQVGGPTNTAGSKYLYFGMRRGGMNYYAMDVTDPLAPSLMWVIEGGSGDFQEMGQSWSEPIVTNVTHGGSTKLALVIGGGYDTTQDTATSYTPDSNGRAVYVVDAVTGAKLWSAGPTGSPDSHDLTLPLTNGIAGDVSVIDFNNDTIADRLYFGDTGGHIWRVDIQGDLNGTAGFTADFSGYELADLHGTSTTDNRRFFARPVAALTPNNKLAIAVGSGHRSHPLDPAVQDRFYVIYDPNGNGVPTSAPTPIVDTDLQDLTGFSGGFSSASALVGGWRIDLDIAGEKVFNAASILRGEVFISTYFPPSTICSNDPDGSRLFVLDLEGNPTRDLDSSITGLDPYVSTLNFGIVSEYTLHYSRHDGNVRGINLPNVQGIYTTGSLFDRFWTNNP